MVHRDVKPQNILIVGDNAGGIAKLADFGTAKDFKQTLAMTVVVGTTIYFAPEKITEKHKSKVDVWSMGILLFEMLSGGDHPFLKDIGITDPYKYLYLLPTLEMK